MENDLYKIKYNILNCIEDKKTEFTDQEYKDMVENLANIDKVQELKLKVAVQSGLIARQLNNINDLRHKLRQAITNLRTVSTKFAMSYDMNSKTCK